MIRSTYLTLAFAISATPDRIQILQIPLQLKYQRRLMADSTYSVSFFRASLEARVTDLISRVREMGATRRMSHPTKRRFVQPSRRLREHLDRVEPCGLMAVERGIERITVELVSA
jgi:hypothetical protein